jgi:hypothetical protein
VGLEVGGKPVTLKEARVTLDVGGSPIQGVAIEAAAAVPGRLGLLLPPRPVPGTYHLTLQGTGADGAKVAVAFDYDARQHAVRAR